MKAYRALIMVAATLLGSSALAATYTVKPGDTLYSIAQKANLDPSQLLTMNHLNSSTIQVGQHLSLGGSASVSKAPVAAGCSMRSCSPDWPAAATARWSPG